MAFSCLLCRQKRFDEVISPRMRDAANERVVSCASCGLIQMETLPSPRKLKAFYDQGKQAGNIGVNVTDIDHLWQRQRVDTMRRVALASKLVGKGARILDIGSGYGFFLREMNKKGRKAEGIEVSALSRRISRRVSDAQVRGIDLASADLRELKGRFDLVTLFFVLEHIRDPAVFLKRVATLLKPGGVIILEVPNTRDSMLKRSPAYNAFFWQFAHCFYPTAATMKKILAKAGLTKTTIFYVQRYSIENHEHWLVHGTPQIKTPSYSTRRLSLKKKEASYKRKLVKSGTADTLIATVRT